MASYSINMLPKPNCLKKSADFNRVFKNGQGIREDFLFLKLAENNQRASRFGFVVGKRFSLKATLRNKMKNKLREALRMSLPKIKPGFDGIFIVQKGVKEDKDYQEIARVVNKLLKKAKLI